MLAYAAYPYDTILLPGKIHMPSYIDEFSWRQGGWSKIHLEKCYDAFFIYTIKVLFVLFYFRFVVFSCFF